MRSFAPLPVVLLGLVTASCASRPITPTAAATAPNATPAAVTAVNVALGDSIYNTGSCQRCHGQKGVGGQNGPSLVVGPWLHTQGTFDGIVATITNGVPRPAVKDSTRRFPMNPRGGPLNLTDEQVKAVAAYVWSISREKR